MTNGWLGGVQADEVIVLGKLTANGVVKFAFGGSSVTVTRDTGKQVSIADDLRTSVRVTKPYQRTPL